MLLQHAVVFVNGEQYYGAKASINVWAPRVTDEFEFSLSQIWVIAGSFGKDLNTIEAGWQACSYLFKTCLTLQMSYFNSYTFINYQPSFISREMLVVAM